MIPHQEESGLLGEVADSKSKAEKGAGGEKRAGGRKGMVKREHSSVDKNISLNVEGKIELENDHFCNPNIINNDSGKDHQQMLKPKIMGDRIFTGSQSFTPQITSELLRGKGIVTINLADTTVT